MKTPEVIKKGLEVCGVLDGDCENCPYDDGLQILCVDRLRKDALAYILQLESRLAQVERERDASVEDIEPRCDYCEFMDNTYGEAPCPTEEKLEEDGFCNGFKWRGVCPENSKEGTNEN